MEDQLLGNYRVLQKIGAGGMARVYLGVHRDIPNLKVVLKILGDPSLVERFRQEADKLALLDGHPNICQIKHFFGHGDDFVIAMEYIDGVTLEEKIQSQGCLAQDEALKIIIDMLKVLDFAHSKGIYHRDIKPGNVMIDRTGRVKIIDFGIAKAKTDPNLTTAGMACGTPAYMAPEQFVPSESTDYALVDIYAIGTTLYFMMTGQLPFKGNNEFAIRDAKLFTEPEKPRALKSDITRELESTILQAIDKEPQKRFQSAGEMLRKLESLQRSQPTKTDQRAGATEKIRKSSRAKKGLLIAVPAALILIIAAVLIINPFGAKEEVTSSSNPDTTVSISAPENIPVAAPTQIETARQGTLEIAIAPFGDLYVDDEFKAGKTDFASLNLDSGKHAIRVENKDAKASRIFDTVGVISDQTTRRRYNFELAVRSEETTPQPPARPQGSLIVGSTPRGADIFLDNSANSQRQTPYTFKLSPGKHIVRVEMFVDGQTVVRTDSVNIVADSSSKLNFNLEQ